MHGIVHTLEIVGAFCLFGECLVNPVSFVGEFLETREVEIFLNSRVENDASFWIVANAGNKLA